MPKFALFFRMDILSEDRQPGPELLKTYMTEWNEWINMLLTENKLSGGNHLSKAGQVIHADGRLSRLPYVANSESVAGYLILNTIDFEETLKFAKSCPILKGEGNSVEIRQLESED